MVISELCKIEIQLDDMSTKLMVYSWYHDAVQSYRCVLDVISDPPLTILFPSKRDLFCEVTFLFCLTWLDYFVQSAGITLLANPLLDTRSPLVGITEPIRGKTS